VVKGTGSMVWSPRGGGNGPAAHGVGDPGTPPARQQRHRGEDEVADSSGPGWRWPRQLAPAATRSLRSGGFACACSGEKKKGISLRHGLKQWVRMVQAIRWRWAHVGKMVSGAWLRSGGN
jgi:hypothetical protein